MGYLRAAVWASPQETDTRVTVAREVTGCGVGDSMILERGPGYTRPHLLPRPSWPLVERPKV